MLTRPHKKRPATGQEREPDASGGLPYVVPVGAGRSLVVLLSPQHYEFDPDGELLLRPDGARHLDKVRAAAADVPDCPSPGWVKSLRSTLTMTQVEFGDAVGVSALTVSRWERGQVSPGTLALRAMRDLRRERATAGIVISD